MPRTISHQLVEQMGAPRKMSQRELDHTLSKIEQSINIADKGLTTKVLSVFLAQKGTSPLLSFHDISTSIGGENATKLNSLQTVLDLLEEADILQTNENCDYRIAGNVLAALLYDKIEADRIVIRKVENFIHDRFNIYQEKNILLTQHDLNYISPYLSSLSISHDELNFIQDSRRELDRKKKRRALIISIIITLLSMISLIAFWQYMRANRALKAAEQATIQAQNEKEKAEKLSRDNALLAEANAAEAQRNKALADSNEVLAKEAQAEARAKAMLAYENRRLAELANERAKRNADLAFQNAQYAKKEALRAEAFETLANKNAALAKKEAARAAIEKKLAAENKALEQIAFSRTLAKQASQLGDEQAELKALLAHTAFDINLNNTKGNIFQQDIYEALYQAVKSIYQAKGNNDFNKIKNERGSINSIAFANTKEGKAFYTASSSGYLKRWQVSSWKDIEKPKFQVQVIAKMNQPLHSLALSDDNKWLVVGGKMPTIQIYNLKDKNAQAQSVDLHDGAEILQLAFIPYSNQLLSLGTNKTIVRYDIENKKATTVATSEEMITTFALSEDAPAVLYYGTASGDLYENNLGGQTELLQLLEPTELSTKITAIAATFQNGRRQIFVGHSNGLLKILESKVGGWFPTNRAGVVSHSISRFHTAEIAAIQASFGGHYIGVASYDGRASIWDVDKAVNDIYYQPMVFSGDSWVTDISFSIKSSHIIIGNREGDLIFFNPSPQVYAEAICQLIERRMTQDEWDLYIGKALAPKTYRRPCK